MNDKGFKVRNILVGTVFVLLLCQRQVALTVLRGAAEQILQWQVVSSSSSNGTFENDEQTTKQYCTRDQIRNKGYWKSVSLPKAPYIPTVAWESTCYRRANGARFGELKQEPFRDTQWAVDDDCIYPSQFDADRFCQVVGNRSIGFLGDSISWQQYNSLTYLTQAVDERRTYANCMSHVCDNNNNTKLYWLRNKWVAAQGMQRMIREIDPEIIVFNRGAHFVSNHSELLEGLQGTLDVLMNWQQDCDERGRDCVLFWRTTAPGFPNCTNTPGPLTNRTFAEAIIQDNSTTSYYALTPDADRFYWWEMPLQNRLVERFFQDYIASKHLRMEFLDFYDMAILRPDNHIDSNDCLHWCLPGPLDAANTLLLNRLEALGVQQRRNSYFILDQ